MDITQPHLLPDMDHNQAIDLILSLFEEYAPKLATSRLNAKRDFEVNPEQARCLARDALQNLEPKILQKITAAEDSIETACEDLDTQITQHVEAKAEERKYSQIFTAHTESYDVMYTLANLTRVARIERAKHIANSQRLTIAMSLLEQPDFAQQPTTRGKTTIKNPKDSRQILRAIIQCEPNSL